MGKQAAIDDQQVRIFAAGRPGGSMTVENPHQVSDVYVGSAIGSIWLTASIAPAAWLVNPRSPGCHQNHRRDALSVKRFLTSGLSRLIKSLEDVRRRI